MLLTRREQLHRDGEDALARESARVVSAVQTPLKGVLAL